MPIGEQRGFSFIELLVVLVIVSLMASIVGPMVTKSVTQARESALKEDLYILRKALDDYFADSGTYPEELNVLVEERYLRHLPEDPVAGEEKGWELVFGEDGNGIVDVRSKSEELAIDGTRYDTW